MKKLIICRGLPGSGKTTWANAQIQRDTHFANGIPIMPPIVRVNQDEIRKELGWTSWATWDFKGPAESKVPGLKMHRIRAALDSNMTVISDDTNLNPKTTNQLMVLAQHCGAKVEVVDFLDVSVDECIRRDTLRGDAAVGAVVIRRMASKYLSDPPPTFAPVVKDPTLPPAIMCDLDGTLSLFTEKGHRGPYDATLCDQDECNEVVKRVLEAASIWLDQRVLFVSGRFDTYRPQTLAFLHQHLDATVIWHEEDLFMRAEGDTRKDWIIKGEIFDRHIRGIYDVQYVLDDRDQVVKFWRSIGLTCLQVAEGAF